MKILRGLLECFTTKLHHIRGRGLLHLLGFLYFFL
jgi:hypothetical protein